MPPKSDSSIILNALAGIIAVAILSGLTWLISQNIDNGKHLVKIDSTLENSSTQVPRIVAEELAEIRKRDLDEFNVTNERIKINETRIIMLEEEIRKKK